MTDYVTVPRRGRSQRSPGSSGDPGLALDDRFRTKAGRVAHRGELRDILTERLAYAGADHWSGLLLAAGVPTGPVNALDEAFAFAQRLGLPGIVDVPAEAAGGADGRPFRQVANPITLSATPARYLLPPPRLGQPGRPGHRCQRGTGTRLEAEELPSR